MCCQGLGDITGNPVHIGAPFQLGVELSGWYADVSFRELPQLLQQMEAALSRSGYTSGLVKIYQIAGSLNPFIVVDGYSGREYGSDKHLRDSVLSVLSSIYQNLNYSSVTFTVATYDAQTGQQQVTTTPAPREMPNGSFPVQVGDTLGSVFGVDAQTGLIIGAFGLLVIITLLRR